MQYDRIDAHILEIVQKNNRVTCEVMAEAVGLSTTACQRRLKRLRSEGIIEADVSIVSAKAVGWPLQMLVLVTLERKRSDVVDRLKKAIKASVEVINGFYITGDADFALYIAAHTMEEYEEFTQRFFYENRDVKSFKTLVVMDRVKAGFAIPVAIPDNRYSNPRSASEQRRTHSRRRPRTVESASTTTVPSHRRSAEL
ncbi:Lrp/AsnC family transcriptional regulator [Bradyrhizobium sp. 35]|nr:Lrp/AsnC family transcriptional regulator [Bradyrhizobium sp. 35]MCK1479656.1 Lrp/AsnC family transcriptional regulator [Bradyrhizobium sp. 197]MCK1518826.1 Lrp/AsnC family transcriptional regulator [Bradyrhizobium sp. 17]